MTPPRTPVHSFRNRRPDPDAAGIPQFAPAGHKIQLDIDIVARRSYIDGAIVMSWRHVDGYAFESPQRQTPFYDVATVRDPARPR